MPLLESPSPIAVVGVGCRFPGDAHDLESLWKLLANGENVWSDVPESRFTWKSFYHPDRGSHSAYSQRGGHFIDQDITAFDAGFFGLSPQEAKTMDPQQRMNLELAYEALENSGIPLEDTKGSLTGVFIAAFTHDYEHMMYKDSIALPTYLMTGTGHAIISNRISYAFDLKGPSMTLDTGCSGGLVALHQACQSLRARDCDMAIVGGSNLILSPDTMMPMDMLHLLDRDGKCYSFDSRGSGYGRGEGVAMVVLKRLEDALEAGDSVRAVIRATAIGQDGKTYGITAPSRTAQEDLIFSAYKSISQDPCQTAYVEAHGTGTIAGDTVELGAIDRVFCTNRPECEPLLLGSIKANIGHLESASGLAGLLKVLLVLEKGLIPPTPNLKELKEGIRDSCRKIKIPRKLETWPPNLTRRASLNSFGYGGSNAHAIVEGANKITFSKPTKNVARRLYASSNLREDPVVSLRDSSNEVIANGTLQVLLGDFSAESLTVHVRKQKYLIFVITAHSEQSLGSTLANLLHWVKASERSDLYLDNLAYTLGTRRSLMSWRHTFVASAHQGVLTALGPNSSRKTKATKGHRVIWIFTGQGAQWSGMAKELLSTSWVFKRSFQQSYAILKALGASWNLYEELVRESLTSRLDESEIGMPLTTAIQIALVQSLRHLGIGPNFVLGHSSGEIAAAYAVGSLSHEDALSVSYQRSFLAKRSKQLQRKPGAMLAVGIGEPELHFYINRIRSGRVVVACSNSPSSTTVSGDEDAVRELRETLHTFGIYARNLKVDTAYHSHYMQGGIAEEYQHQLRNLRPQSAVAGVIFYSTVTGTKKSSGFDAAYWATNLVSKVSFYDTLRNMCTEMQLASHGAAAPPCHTFVEIGPHNSLTGPIKQTLTHLKLDLAGLSFISPLLRDRDSEQTFLILIGKLLEKGYPINISRANSLDSFDPIQHKATLITTLAPYPWDHSESYWYESRVSKEHRLRSFAYHDLLGLRQPGDSVLEPTWRHLIDLKSLPWLHDHAIDGRIVFPASGYIAMAIEAKRQITIQRWPLDVVQSYKLKDIVFSKFLEISNSSDKVESQISLRCPTDVSDRSSTAWEEFRITSISFEGVAEEHCRGFIRVKTRILANNSEKYDDSQATYLAKAQEEVLSTLKKSSYPKLYPHSFYDELRSNGNHWGPNFSAITHFSAGNFCGTGKVTVPDVSKCMPCGFMQQHVIHPTTLDALIHTGLVLYSRACNRGLMFPTRIGEVTISTVIESHPNEELEFATRLSLSELTSASIEVSVFQRGSDSKPELCAHVRDAEIRGMTNRKAESPEVFSNRDMCYQLQWDADIDLCPPAMQAKHASQPVCNAAQGRRLRLLNQAAFKYTHAYLLQATRTGVKPHHQKFYRWMELIQQESVLYQPDAKDSPQGLGVLGDALTRVGSNLTRILAGSCDPLSLLLEDDLLSRVYAEDPASRRCYRYLTHYVKHLVFKYPQMKVLEIGAGTGGATLPLLQAIDVDGRPSLDQYDFTDVSAGFFESAKTKFEQWASWLQFKTLDISKDPVQQGFFENSYDLIVAFNALHVTNSVDDSIANARKLLKTGGRLILIEITRLVPYINMIYGVLPGWFLERSDGRRDSPILTTEQWNSRLMRGSFAELEYVNHDYEGDGHTHTIMVSRAVSANVNPASPGIIRVLAEPHPGSDTNYLARSLAQYSSDSCQWNTQITVEEFPIKEINQTCVYLVIDGNASSFLADQSFEISGRIDEIFGTARNILWLSSQPNSFGAPGRGFGAWARLARTIRAKNPGLKLVTLGMRQVTVQSLSEVYPNICKILQVAFFNSIQERSLELDYVYDKGLILIPRLLPDDDLNKWVRQAGKSPFELELSHQRDRPWRPNLNFHCLGDGLGFAEDPTLSGPLHPDEIEILAQASRLNTEDAIVKLGESKVPQTVSGTCAGTVVAIGHDVQHLYRIGDRVCSWGSAVSASRTRVKCDSAHRLAQSVPFDLGAAIPATFGLAYYGLVNIAGLRKDHTILFHVPCGDFAPAAICIAQSLGARIVATVQTASQRKTLVETFRLHESCIFPDSTAAYNIGVRTLTNNTGVNVIFGSLSIDSFQSSWTCLAPFGTVIGIGSIRLNAGGPTHAKSIKNNITVANLDFTTLTRYRPSKFRRAVSSVITMYEEGKLRIPRFTTDSAFKIHRSGEGAGSFFVEANEDSTVNSVPSGCYLPEQLCQSGTYVVAGDLIRLGLDVCRFMARKGAKYLVLVCLRIHKPWQQQTIEAEFGQIGINFSIAFNDVSPLAGPTDSRSCVPSTWPPVRGVVQTDVEADVRNAFFLPENLWSFPLDFYILLRSATSILGVEDRHKLATMVSSHKIIASGNVEANMKCKNFVTLELGPLTGSAFTTAKLEPAHAKFDKAFVPVTNIELENLLEFAMYERAGNTTCRNLFAGFDRQSLAQTENKSLPLDPIFSALPYTERQAKDATVPNLNIDIIEETLHDAKTPMDAQRIVSSALRAKISTFIVIKYELIDLGTPLEDFGLDSLVMFSFRNWIYQNFRADLKSHEISDAINIASLADLILDQSTIAPKPWLSSDKPNPQCSVPMTGSYFILSSPTHESVQYPRQPLPLLEDALQLYLDSARSFCTGEEFETTRLTVARFQSSDGLGHQLHHRLARTAANPEVQNWLADLYIKRRFLRLRTSLATGQTYFGTHPLGKYPHQQAERAAIISAATLQFKEALELGRLDPQYLSGQAIDPYSYHWLFNACREPHSQEDYVRKYPPENHIVVLRHGYAYKFTPENSLTGSAFVTLKATFEAILKIESSDVYWISVLTADERERWAKIRKSLIEMSETNRASMHEIEAATFIVCLDDGSPGDPNERFRQFMFADKSNRWYDKTLQLIVCENGTSASVCEHSSLDGVSIGALHHFINRAILEHDPKKASITEQEDVPHPIPRFKPLILSTDTEIDSLILKVRKDLETTSSNSTFAYLEAKELCSDFLRSYKCPVQSGIQIAIQVACRRFFGYNPPACETVSMAHFCKGRVDINHTIQPPVATFLAAAAATVGDVGAMTEGTCASDATLRDLFYEAARSHAKSLSRVAKGRGFSRYLLAMEWMLGEGEETPAFFKDPTYSKMRPGKVLTSSFETGWMEGGFVYPVAESILVYFEVKDQNTSFSIFGRDVDAATFRNHLAFSLRTIRRILTSSR